jgi:hypothetical protein
VAPWEYLGDAGWTDMPLTTLYKGTRHGRGLETRSACRFSSDMSATQAGADQIYRLETAVQCGAIELRSALLGLER